MTDAALAAALLAVDPRGLGGALLAGPPGPGRDGFLALHRRLRGAGPEKRLPAHADDAVLDGALDLSATLASGAAVLAPGLLAAAAGGTLVLPLAGRMTPALAARLAAGQERHGFAMLALAEGEDAPTLLTDRLAFWLSVEALPGAGRWCAADIRRAQGRRGRVVAGDAVIEPLLGVALACGVASLRAPWMALRAAIAHAALHGRDAPGEEDLDAAVRLVLAPRATQLPAPEPAPPEPPPPEAEHRDNQDRLPDEMPSASEAASLPPHLLQALAAGLRLRRAESRGASGATRTSTTRGRPIGTQAGRPGNGARLALLETLRAAAPWQRLRPPPRRGALALRGQDFRIRRFREATESTAIFVLDASGSAALHRLGEAKGAVELLLADCYARRDRVAVIAFRGAGAEALLPPTHSLVRAKRALAGLPGGGASPLAAGLDAGLALARQERRAGRTPLLVVLTDGRANVARDGARGREAAEADALAVARAVRAEKAPILVVDTAPRPQPFARELAAMAGGTCLPLPAARAEALAAAVRVAA